MKKGHKLSQLFLIYLATFFTIPAFAQTIKGSVTDAVTKEFLIGTNVKIKETGKVQPVQLDGFYNFKDIKAGTYTLQFRILSYVNKEAKVTVGKGVSIVNVEMKPDAVMLNETGVVANQISNDRRARTLERNATQVLNIISAQNIELSPDITVANVMQRVSGVTIERSSSGEGRYPIIRGMEKRYINTLVNGIKIPSPDNKNRFIPLDLFPSELLERLEVSKTLIPSMEGDAIGGTINLVMKDAPARELLQINVATGYNTAFSNRPYQQFDKSTINKLAPSERFGSDYNAKPSDFPVNNLNYSDKNTPINTTFGITYGNRFGVNKKLGFLLSGSYQDKLTGNNSTFFLPNAQPSINNIPQFIQLQSRAYSQQSKRIGINNKIDYKFNDRNKLSLINVFVRLDDYQTRIVADTIALNSLIDAQSRSRWQYQSIFSSALKGEHKMANDFKFDWSLSYSTANNSVPDQADFTHEYSINKTETSQDILQGMTRIWTHNSDQDYAAYANLHKKFDLLGKKFELQIGGVERNKTRNSYFNSYGLTPVLIDNKTQEYTSINNASYTFKETDGGKVSPNGNNYNFTENVFAGYAQAEWHLTEKLTATGGLRIEHTKQNYTTELPLGTAAKNGLITYTDFLPSGIFKYKLNANQNLRLSYYRALARPGFAELIPDGQQGEIFKESGNPVGLNHTTADNIDFRYELFPKNADELLLGVFYKNIQNPIEFAAVKTGVTTQTLIPQNFGDARNFGFEAVYTKYFGPFGVVANYTYTQSKITSDKLFSYRNDAGQVSSRIQSETRPLQGQSENIGNLALIYKNPKLGFDVQTAFVYTGERIALVSPYFGLDYWQAPTKQLDFSVEKKFAKKFSVYGKINNLTNTPYILRLKQSYNMYLQSPGARPLNLQTNPDENIIVQKDYFKTSFLIGLRYKL
ncbi:TonB-dependent receptor [Pedobacter changchengzhani]|uniref:TonB-dependent receptor n=1 Tax=Pedobacter changchengzhani TaxID=2529274 RepID=A0A4R5MKX4_9SPHI|nr:TonB-dependent receptor [Pedobacter changchengzhani]TDG36334.1 TonB-dependent receptor [Pedobacter changchengzhani]